MKRMVQFRSLKTRLLVWFLVVSLVPLGLLSLSLYVQEAASMKASSFEKLAGIRDLRMSEVNTWLDERIADIKIIASDFEVRNLESSFQNHENGDPQVVKVEAAQNVLAHHAGNIRDYHEIFIINAHTGRVEISSSNASQGLDRSDDPYFTEPLRTGQVFIHDIHYSKTLGKLSMKFSSPIYCLAHQGEHLFGVLVARIDLDQSLYALLLDRTGMG
jgi:hypothetical protein